MKNGRGQQGLDMWLIPLCPYWMQRQLEEEPGQQNMVLKPQSMVGTGFPVMDVATGPGCHTSLPQSNRLGEVSN